MSFVLLISTVCKRQFVSERYSAAVHVTAVVLLSGGRYGSLTGRVESTGAAILFGDLSDEGMECDDNYLGQRDGNSQCAEDATADHYCCIEMDAADICFRWRGQEERGVREKSDTHSTQMVRFSAKITRGYWPSKESYYAFRCMKLSHYR